MSQGLQLVSHLGSCTLPRSGSPVPTTLSVELNMTSVKGFSGMACRLQSRLKFLAVQLRRRSSFSGGGHGNPLQCSSLGNPMDRGAWQATVHGVMTEAT